MRVCILTVTQNTVTLTNTRGNTPAEGRPRSVFLRDTASTEPTVLCYTCALDLLWSRFCFVSDNIFIVTSVILVVNLYIF